MSVRPNLSPEAMPWAREQEKRTKQAAKDLKRTDTNAKNVQRQNETAIRTLSEQVRLGVANTYSKTEIDDALAVRDSAIAGKANTVHTHDQSQISGTWTKAVDTSGVVKADGGLVSVGTVNKDISGQPSRFVIWGATGSGDIGNTSSSARFKQDIEDFEWDYEALRRVRVVLFRYIKAVETYGDDAQVEFGVIAEEIEALGLEFLLARDAEGQIHSVQHPLFGFLAIYLAQKQGDIIDQMQADIAALKEAVYG